MAYALMWLLITRMDATRVASLFYFGPPVTMLMGWAAFGDRLLITDWVGLGVTAVQRIRHRFPKKSRPFRNPLRNGRRFVCRSDLGSPI
jgi:threonine/homoserine efflux transporter RhtA